MKTTRQRAQIIKGLADYSVLLRFCMYQEIVGKQNAYNDQGEGYYDNVNTGRDEGRIEYSALGANLLFTPTDQVELEYTYQRERTDQDTPPLLNVGQPGQLFCDVFNFCSPDEDTPVSGDRWKTFDWQASKPERQPLKQ